MHRHARKAGFSLIELLIVVTMIGILTAMVSPSIRRAMLRNNVTNARNAIANLYTSARLAGAQTTRSVLFRRSGNVVVVEAWPRLVAVAGSTLDTVGTVIDLNDRFGVTVSNTSVADFLQVNPKGFGSASLTWVVTRAEFSDSVRINNLGVLVR